MTTEIAEKFAKDFMSKIDREAPYYNIRYDIVYDSFLVFRIQRMLDRNIENIQTLMLGGITFQVTSYQSGGGRACSPYLKYVARIPFNELINYINP